ncbi:SDR family NAD(P)-dependent oxidoreductase [Bacillus solimangrovi]|uniref:Short-chain dehydrogenase n=1 Tax=Bacillus solimangrovi TaxID=1305675 RepID=A0A1E5LK25_9BACI|nr:SDR family oxidoreductase [Bacillus solimangrovi]OEH94386.1 short-chain dehydrogenase [Bacillus solimangrovi]
MNDLSSLVVVITGGGSGLGKETAISFANRGAKVVICGRRKQKLDKVIDLLPSSLQQNMLTIEADVSVEEDVKRLIQVTETSFGQIDVLINNAAVFEQHDIIDMPLESWSYQFTNNVTSVFLMTRECIPIMQKQQNGRIINITSGLAKEGAAGFAAYSASKAAIETFTYSLEDEEYKSGIKSYVFNPGVMKTNLQAQGDDPANIAPYLVELATGDYEVQKYVFDTSSISLEKTYHQS